MKGDRPGMGLGVVHPECTCPDASGPWWAWLTGRTRSLGNTPSRYILPPGVQTKMAKKATSWLEKLSSLAHRHPVWPQFLG